MEFISNKLSKTLDSTRFKDAVFTKEDTTPLKKGYPPLPLNNMSIHGYSIERKMTTSISISNPKIWPEDGKYIESVKNIN